METLTPLDSPIPRCSADWARSHCVLGEHLLSHTEFVSLSPTSTRTASVTRLAMMGAMDALTHGPRLLCVASGPLATLACRCPYPRLLSSVSRIGGRGLLPPQMHACSPSAAILNACGYARNPMSIKFEHGLGTQPEMQKRIRMSVPLHRPTFALILIPDVDLNSGSVAVNGVRP
jgi:hypothetical protein